MGRLRGLKIERRPPRLDTFTDIHAPSVKKERVNGKDKYSLTPAKAGIITILSDDENEKDRTSRSRDIKRERSQVPPRAVGHDHRSSQPRIKQEPPPDRHGRQQSHGEASPGEGSSGTRQAQVHGPLRRHGAHGLSNPPIDTSSSSDSSESDSSDSSESEDESDSSSDSSSSDGSSSGDETSASVYRPSTPASSIGSSSPRRRRKNEAVVRAASASLGATSPSRGLVQDKTSIGSGHVPLNFFIPLPARSLQSRSEQSGQSRSQTSSAVMPTGAQVSSCSLRSVRGVGDQVTEPSDQADRTARSSQQRPVNKSPIVLGFMPINRGSPPPRNAPTEPRAMRTGAARPADTPTRAPQRQSIPINEPVSGPSPLPFRILPSAKDKSKQNDQQRRGPARPGRVMQTVEQPPKELLSARSQPQSGPSSSHLRPATPGPSSRRTAPPQPSPGIFVTPRSVSVMPRPFPESQDSPQSVSRSRGKRAFVESEDTDSTSKAAEWERMLERFKSHEKEMEQQRAQLEDTKRLLAEQKTRIDDLERRRRAEELLRNPNVRTRTEERDGSPPEAAPRDVAIPPVAVPQHLAPPPDADAQVVAPQRVSSRQAQRREERRRCNPSQATSQRARARQKKRERQRLERERQEGIELERQQLEQERQEDLELEQQLEQEQRREAERQERGLQRVTRRLQNGAQRAPAQSEAQIEADAQTRIQHEIFTRPLSGHNPRIIFDDDDRPHISEATAFLMRLPQAFVMAKLRKLVEGKAFFDVAHPGSVHMGCWVVSSRRASCDMRMKLTDSGEKHGFSFPRLAVRLWHDEQSIYSLLQHHKHRQKAVHTCHTETCMRPDHIVVEPSSAAAERRRCKREGWCPGHEFVHKDGTRQPRRPCIFPPQNAFLRR